jgi:tRNA (cytidine/uridine-2'-O-)-methyltransferase
MRIALFEPDIPQNTGTILRLAACLGIEAHIIEPAGFPTSDRAFRRAGMDYLDQVEIMRHPSWEAFEGWRRGAGARLILFTTRASRSYLDHAFRADDVLLFGRESAGVPQPVHDAADARLVIPMREGLRSLNVAMAAAMAAGEAIRQIGKVSAETAQGGNAGDEKVGGEKIGDRKGRGG